jgi:uncharacterized protein (TIGR03437 family)
MSDAEFYAGLAHLLAMANDTHTSLLLNSAPGFHVFPLQFRWFDDGVFVTGAAAEYTQALGAQLVAIGGVPIDDVVARLATVISHESDQGLRSTAQRYLRGQQILQGLHVVDSSATSPLTFRTLAGDQFTLQVGIPSASYAMTYAPDASQGSYPDYMAQPSVNYWFHYAPANRLLYFKYNMCADMAAPFASFASGLLQSLDANPVDTLVFDFRGNPGGNSSVINPLITGLQQRMPALLANPAFRFYAAFDKNTFSSADLNLMYLKSPDQGWPDIVQFIGEPTGEPPGGYGNAVGFTLPYSGTSGQYATKPFPPPYWMPPGPVLAPDVAISVRSTDFFARFDPVMAAIIAGSSGEPVASSGDVIAVNGASFRSDQGMAPGSLAVAFGQFSATPDELLVSGTAGQIAAASTSQVNFVVPDSVAPGPATISVRAGGQELASGQADITATGPAIFIAQPGDPSQPGLVQNGDGSVNSSSNPAARGASVQIFMTGIGSGRDTLQVYFGNTPVPGQVLSIEPAGAGVWQIAVQMPDTVTSQVPIFITAGSGASNGITIWVQ